MMSSGPRTRIAIEASPDGGVAIKPEVVMPVDVNASLSEAILGLDALLAKKGKRGLFVLDEFQEITAVDKAGPKSLEAEFRTVVQSAGNSSFAFLGSQPRVLADMFTIRNRPFYQAAKIIELGPIGRTSLRTYIRERFQSTGIQISHVETLLDTVEGHPDYTQRICSHLYDIATISGDIPTRVQMDQSLARRALNEMIESCALIFISEWQTYPLRQQQALSLLAEKGPLRRVSSMDLAEYDMVHTSFNTALKQLIRKGAIREDDHGYYRLTDPIFRRWITREKG
jgi:hypothetical protein